MDPFDMLDMLLDMAQDDEPSDKRRKSRLDKICDDLRSRGWEPGSAADWDADLTATNYDILAGLKLKHENLLLACVAVELLVKNQPDMVRGVMYSVVSAGWLPDTSKKSYGRIQRLLVSLRKRGVLPFEWITDNIRATIKPSSWSGLADFTQTVQDAYRKDFWAQLPECVEVIVEKDSAAGRIAPVTREYDVAMHPLRGYSSTSFAYSIAQNWKDIEKPLHVYYIGDHDPSGRDIERNIIESLHKYGACDFAWQRLAVTPEQFDEFDIIPLDPKKNDRRYQVFVDEYGERCAEVEAIPAATLRDMVRTAIGLHIPKRKWNQLKKVEAQERESWQDVMRTMAKDSA